MVLIQSAGLIESQPIPNELCMESGNIIPFIAPVSLNNNNSTNAEHQKVVLLAQEKRLLFGDLNEEMDKWSGASEFCTAIDSIVEIESETDFFKNKKVLEVGFSTALPTIYALEHGASSATLVYPSDESYQTYIKPTMEQNKNVSDNINIVIGDVDNLEEKISEKFDIILAPELVLTNSKYFDKIHALLDSALADNGIIILSGRTHYHNSSGNMSLMLEMIKTKGRFVVIDRTPECQRHDTAPRKIVQLMRMF
jgi:hypothetical protein